MVRTAPPYVPRPLPANSSVATEPVDFDLSIKPSLSKDSDTAVSLRSYAADWPENPSVAKIENSSESIAVVDLTGPRHNFAKLSTDDEDSVYGTDVDTIVEEVVEDIVVKTALKEVPHDLSAKSRDAAFEVVKTESITVSNSSAIQHSTLPDEVIEVTTVETISTETEVLSSIPEIGFDQDILEVTIVHESVEEISSTAIVTSEASRIRNDIVEVVVEELEVSTTIPESLTAISVEDNLYHVPANFDSSIVEIVVEELEETSTEIADVSQLRAVAPSNVSACIKDVETVVATATISVPTLVNFASSSNVATVVTVEEIQIVEDEVKEFPAEYQEDALRISIEECTTEVVEVQEIPLEIVDNITSDVIAITVEEEVSTTSGVDYVDDISVFATENAVTVEEIETRTAVIEDVALVSDAVTVTVEEISSVSEELVLDSQDAAVDLSGDILSVVVETAELTETSVADLPIQRSMDDVLEGHQTSLFEVVSVVVEEVETVDESAVGEYSFDIPSNAVAATSEEVTTTSARMRDLPYNVASSVISSNSQSSGIVQDLNVTDIDPQIFEITDEVLEDVDESFTNDVPFDVPANAVLVSVEEVSAVTSEEAQLPPQFSADARQVVIEEVTVVETVIVEIESLGFEFPAGAAVLVVDVVEETQSSVVAAIAAAGVSHQGGQSVVVEETVTTEADGIVQVDLPDQAVSVCVEEVVDSETSVVEVDLFVETAPAEIVEEETVETTAEVVERPVFATLTPHVEELVTIVEETVTLVQQVVEPVDLPVPGDVKEVLESTRPKVISANIWEEVVTVVEEIVTSVEVVTDPVNSPATVEVMEVSESTTSEMLLADAEVQVITIVEETVTVVEEVMGSVDLAATKAVSDATVSVPIFADVEVDIIVEETITVVEETVAVVEEALKSVGSEVSASTTAELILGDLEEQVITIVEETVTVVEEVVESVNVPATVNVKEVSESTTAEILFADIKEQVVSVIEEVVTVVEEVHEPSDLPVIVDTKEVSEATTTELSLAEVDEKVVTVVEETVAVTEELVAPVEIPVDLNFKEVSQSTILEGAVRNIQEEEEFVTVVEEVVVVVEDSVASSDVLGTVGVKEESESTIQEPALADVEVQVITTVEEISIVVEEVESVDKFISPVDVGTTEIVLESITETSQSFVDRAEPVEVAEYIRESSELSTEENDIQRLPNREISDNVLTVIEEVEVEETSEIVAHVVRQVPADLVEQVIEEITTTEVEVTTMQIPGAKTTGDEVFIDTVLEVEEIVEIKESEVVPGGAIEVIEEVVEIVEVEVVDLAVAEIPDIAASINIEDVVERSERSTNAIVVPEGVETVVVVEEVSIVESIEMSQADLPINRPDGSVEVVEIETAQLDAIIDAANYSGAPEEVVEIVVVEVETIEPSQITNLVVVNVSSDVVSVSVEEVVEVVEHTNTVVPAFSPVNALCIEEQIVVEESESVEELPEINIDGNTLGISANDMTQVQDTTKDFGGSIGVANVIVEDLCEISESSVQMSEDFVSKVVEEVYETAESIVEALTLDSKVVEIVIEETVQVVTEVVDVSESISEIVTEMATNSSEILERTSFDGNCETVLEITESVEELDVDDSVLGTSTLEVIESSDNVTFAAREFPDGAVSVVIEETVVVVETIADVDESAIGSVFSEETTTEESYVNEPLPVEFVESLAEVTFQTLEVVETYLSDQEQVIQIDDNSIASINTEISFASNDIVSTRDPSEVIAEIENEYVLGIDGSYYEASESFDLLSKHLDDNSSYIGNVESMDDTSSIALTIPKSMDVADAEKTAYVEEKSETTSHINIEDAVEYLDKVKRVFAKQPEVFNRFLDTMSEFKSRRIGTVDVMYRIMNAFFEHPTLVYEFGIFLPKGYSIEASDDPLDPFVVYTPEGVSVVSASRQLGTISEDPEDVAESIPGNFDSNLEFFDLGEVDIQERVIAVPPRERFAEFSTVWDSQHITSASVKAKISAFVAGAFFSASTTSRTLLLSSPHGKKGSRVLEYVSSSLFSGNGNVLCLAGPSGCGKTTISQLLAESLDLVPYRVNLAEIRTVANIVGDAETQTSSVFAKIAAATPTGSMILFDDFDKLDDPTKEISTTLLRVLSSKEPVFVDEVVGQKIDLTSTLFVLTTNDASLLPGYFTNLPKVTTISIPEATLAEKAEIAYSAILAAVLDQFGLMSGMNGRVEVQRSAIEALVYKYMPEANFTQLEKEITWIVSHVCDRLLRSEDSSYSEDVCVVDGTNLTEYMGSSDISIAIEDNDMWASVGPGSCVWVGKDGELEIVDTLVGGPEDGQRGIVTNHPTSVEVQVGVTFAKRWLKVSQRDVYDIIDAGRVFVDTTSVIDDGTLQSAIAFGIVSSALGFAIPGRTAILCSLKLNGAIVCHDKSMLVGRIVKAAQRGAKTLILASGARDVWKSIPTEAVKGVAPVFASSFQELVGVFALE